MTVTEPVLLMGFNRPDVMAVVFQRLREVRPQRLFVAVDGPRVDHPEDLARVQACRDLVDGVDWPCEVRTLFQDVNLGCGKGVSTAITWFFSHVERGIILEDDIVPDPSFFGYCAELLERYADDERVFAISGCNYVPQEAQSDPDRPYRFSSVPHVWGWATWRRSWRHHDLNISNWRKRIALRELWRKVDHSLFGTAYWAATFEILARDHVDTWDVQLVLAAMSTGQLTATTNINLVENIGFGVNATHTAVDRDELQPVGAAVSPLPDVPVRVDSRADAWTRRHHYLATGWGMTQQFSRYLDKRMRKRT